MILLLYSSANSLWIYIQIHTAFLLAAATNCSVRHFICNRWPLLAILTIGCPFVGCISSTILYNYIFLCISGRAVLIVFVTIFVR